MRMRAWRHLRSYTHTIAFTEYRMRYVKSYNAPPSPLVIKKNGNFCCNTPPMIPRWFIRVWVVRDKRGLLKSEREAYAHATRKLCLWWLCRYLEMTLQGKIRLQYVGIVWKSLTHPVAINSGFKFLRSNWGRIKSVYGGNKRVLKAIFEDFLARLTTMVDLEDVSSQNFF